MKNRYVGIVIHMNSVRHHTSQVSPYSWNISATMRMYTENQSPAYFLTVL